MTIERYNEHCCDKHEGMTMSCGQKKDGGVHNKETVRQYYRCYHALRAATLICDRFPPLRFSKFTIKKERLEFEEKDYGAFLR